MAELLQTTTQIDTTRPAANDHSMDQNTTRLGMQWAEGTAWHLIEDAEKAQRWIQKAKLAIDVAQASLEKAEKLASHVSSMHPDPEVGMKHHLDIESLRRGAVNVQTSLKESRASLLQTRFKLEGQSLRSTVELKDQAVELAMDLERTIERAIKAQEGEQKRRESTPLVIDAEILLKGQGIPSSVAMSENSLNKIDGVDKKLKSLSSQSTSNGSTSTSSNKADNQTLKAADVLKQDGILVADPVSLDKIDGIPETALVQNNEEEKLTTIPLEDGRLGQDAAMEANEDVKPTEGLLVDQSQWTS